MFPQGKAHPVEEENAATCFGVYSYPPVGVGPVYALFFVGAAVSTAVPSVIFFASGAGALPWVGWVTLLSMPTLFAIATAGAFYKWQPIRLDEQGIAKRVPGFGWKVFRWQAVRDVEQFVFLNYTRYNRMIYVRVWSGRQKIVFDGYIKDVDKILDTINICVSQYKVAFFETDPQSGLRHSRVARLHAVK